MTSKIFQNNEQNKSGAGDSREGDVITSTQELRCVVPPDSMALTE